MNKEEIVSSLQQLANEGEIEILSQNKYSITVWDNAECGKELTYYFKEFMTPESVSRKVYVSPNVPDKYKTIFSKKDIAKFLHNKIDRICLLTMKAVFVLYDSADEFGDECDGYRKKLMDVADGDEYAYEICHETIGTTWWERNICVINASQIIEAVLEMYDEDEYQFEVEVDIGLWTTLIHELRHLLLDTNIILPENEYPIELASEENVEAYCLSHYSAIRQHP